MSLLTEMMEKCVLMDRRTASDGAFGRAETYVEGAPFEAVIVKDSTTEGRLAEKLGVTEVYTVVTQKGFGLDYHEVFKRLSDGAIFRVTSNQTDSEAPQRSTVQIGKVTAERWVLPA